MRRGRTQAIYRYLPGAVIDHTDTQTIAKVTNWRVRELRDINMDRLIEEIRRKMDWFKGRWSYSREIKKRDFVILGPTGIEVEIFPLTFACRKCSRVVSFRSTEEMRRKIADKGYTCPQPGCGGILDQMDLVHYHTCGRIEGLSVKKCPEHGLRSIVLDKHGSDSLSKWRWKCTICGREVGRIAMRCRDCGAIMKTAPFRKRDVFYPQSIIMINVPGVRTSLIERKLLIGVYLGVLEYQEIEALKDSAESEEAVRKVERNIEELRKSGIPDKHLEKIRKQFLKTNEKTKDSVLEEIESLLEIDENRIISVSDLIHDFIETQNLAFVHSLEDMERDARQTDNPAAAIIVEYPKKLREIGIKNAWVIGDFPVLQAVFGYTRGSALPSECTLRSFPMLDEQYPGKTPIYSVATETEAILMEMDREMILHWLQKNGTSSNLPTGEEDCIQKAWFLNNINPDAIPLYDEIHPEYGVTKAVYTLIHTISHSLMNYASSLIGLDKSSLAEIIFPNIPAFIIYSNQATDFQLGGMFTLMESSIIPWIDSTVSGIERCLYDPVCMETGSSCHACLHASEITCTHFNQDLGRDVLIGRKDKIKGFWEHLYT